MLLADFDFDLPEDLIARFPPELRGQSRLLALEKSAQPPFLELEFADVARFLSAGDVLIRNNTKVMKARLFGEKSSGGKVEMLVERVLGEREVLAHLRASKSPKIGAMLHFGEEKAEVLDRRGALFYVRFLGEASVLDILEAQGHLPLPPYLERAAQAEDDARYQTIYAQHLGAVAAPTAGLHFTEDFTKSLQNQGVIIADLTLHVGAGTFQPVRVDDISQHEMHAECFEIPPETLDILAQAKDEHRRIIAVGTTSLRALEAAAQAAALPQTSVDLPFFSRFDRRKMLGKQETQIFITPGFEFKMVDALITNFHLPRSTLLMLVAAFAGRERILAAYAQAMRSGFRFYSYGDAMFLERV